MKQVLLALYLALTPISLFADTLEGNVVKVADGDTITIIDGKGNYVYVVKRMWTVS